MKRIDNDFPSRFFKEHGRKGLWVLCALLWLTTSASVLAQGLPPTNSEPQVLVGELSGEFSVNNLGAANYTVPLAIPPGTAGVEPKLAISYSSRGGNGLLGVGFSLDGLSTITRGGASLDQDGFIDGVDFDGNDRFLLDGQRLEIVAINGTPTNDPACYGNDGSEYRTEIDSFSRVVAHGQAGNGPVWFEVWTKSGLIYEYGNTDDSSFEPGTHTNVLSWAVNKVSDTVGNYMEFTYATNSSGPIIERIDYTANDSASLSAYNSVHFEYEGRPDPSLRFFLGARMEQTNRLAKIVMKHDGEHMHDYRLSYTNSAAGQSLPLSLQQFFGEGTDVDRLPETRFEYGGVSAGTNFNYTSGTNFLPTGLNFEKGYTLYSDRVLTADFNGDGLTDICCMGTENRWLGLSNGDGTFSFTSGTNLLSSGLDFQNYSLGYFDQTLTGDFNGDGLADMCSMGSANTHRWLGLSDGDGTFTFTSGTNLLSSGLGFSNEYLSYSDRVLTGDFNGDGLTDICGMSEIDTHRWLGLSNGNGTFAFTSGTNLLDSGLGFYSHSVGYLDEFLSGDFNGDGMTDILGIGSASTRRWLGLSNGDGTFSFTSGTNLLSSGLDYESGYTLYSDRVLTADFNGDGLTDICCMGTENRWLGLSNGDGTFSFTSGTNLLSSGLDFQNYSLGYFDQTLTGDFNGDGLADMCSMGSANTHRWLGLSDGDGTFTFTSGTNLLSSGLGFSNEYLSYSDRVLTGDFNGDGLTDICGMSEIDTHRWLGLSNGNGTFAFTSGTNLLDSGLGFYSHSVGYSDEFLSGDFNGDGLPDLFSMGGEASHRWVGLNGNESARIEKIVQGYQTETEYGVATQIEYLPLTDTNIYIKGSGAQFPIRDIVSPTHVVSMLEKDNGQGGTYCTDYTYRAARYHVHGRGFLGFQQFESYDRQTQISTAETLAHDFPFTGRILQTETFYIPDPLADPGSPGYKELVKLVENDWHFDLVAGATNSVFAFNPKSVETVWELGNTNDVVNQTTTWNWFDNQDTNSLPPTSQPTNLYAEISYGDLVKSVVDYGDGGLKATAVKSYDNWVDSTHWLLGWLDESEVTHEATSQNPVVRSSSFDYDSVTGLLAQETIEPGDAQFELITDYYYDSFGNITNKTLSPARLPSRTVLSVEYDSLSRFVEKSWNALGHETTFGNDQQTGKPTSSTDPNQLTTSWSYDHTGRMTSETRPDGTTTTIGYFWDYATTVTIPSGPGSTSNIVQTSVYRKNIKTSGAPEVLTWFDKNGREIRTQTESADGRLVNKDTGYNAIAQTHAVSEPYFAAGGTPVYTFTDYDALSRPKMLTAPDSTKTAFGYHGLTTTTTNNFGATDGPTASRNQVTSTTKNAKGETVSASTPLTISHLHDPVGNLIKTTDPDRNEIVMQYDLRGNKTWQDDPDMGEWFYTHNALDQLTSQTDANGNIIQTAYDLLGRATARTNWIMKATLELESTASWIYDGTGEGEKLGLLRREEHRDSSSALINRKTYAYDSLSRPMLELMNYDGKWYYTTLRYDSFSRVEFVDRFWRPKGKEGPTYNLDPEWNRFTTQNAYNNLGALLEVSDGDSHTWWQAAASDYDEQGRLVRFEYGNGLTTTNHFNSLTGRMEGSGIPDGILGMADYQYRYDRLGNLTQRSLSRGMSNLVETCTYDSLNRLTRVDDASSFVSVAYDALGNIENRSDVGPYLYNGSRPHAVTSTGDCDYFYDANGNIVRRDRNSQYEFTANWNSFNKPTSIFAGMDGSEFEYSVDGRRTKQLIFEGTNVTKKVYATLAYEIKETLLNPAETNRANWQWEMDFVRIYVDTPVGKIGIYQQEGNTNGVGTVTRNYIHKDHLGSVVAVSDDSAYIVHYSFDAWGNRRDASDWSPIAQSPESIASPYADRGFTGHEQLDHLQLVHMNGRIYDPVIGRMISPDPLIQAPENLQSFNRYSYVFNNPLSYIDPSGFIVWKRSGFNPTDPDKLYERYAELIDSEPLSYQDFINTITVEQDIEVETEHHEHITWIDDSNHPDGGYYETSQSTATTITTKPSISGGVKEIASSISSVDLVIYGLNTGHEEAVRPAQRYSIISVEGPKAMAGEAAAKYRKEALGTLSGYPKEIRTIMAGDLAATVADKENHERRRDIYEYPGKPSYAGKLQIGDVKHTESGETFYDFGKGSKTMKIEPGKTAKRKWSGEPIAWYQRTADYHPHPYIHGEFQPPSYTDTKRSKVPGFVLTKNMVYYSPVRQRGWYVELGKPEDLLK